MAYRVHAFQTAFAQPGEKIQIRPIDIPDSEVHFMDLDNMEPGAVADLAFHYGQNDFQPSEEHYSVSVGDLIDLGGDENEGRYQLVESFGFRTLSFEEAYNYLHGVTEVGSRGMWDRLNAL